MKIFNLLFSLFTLCASLPAISQPGTVDTTFNKAMFDANGTGLGPGYSSNTTIQSIVQQPDGKFIIGGFFTSFNMQNSGPVVRLLEDGRIDNSFTSLPAGQQINVIALQADGKILVGGFFNTYDGSQYRKLVRLEADGWIDYTFNTGTGLNNGASGWVNAIVVQPDGKIIVGGNFNTFNGQPCGGIVRLNEDGTIDQGFNPGTGCVNGEVSAIALNEDGSILLGGTFDAFSGQASSNALVRLNSDGTVDGTFVSGIEVPEYVSALAVTPGQKIYVGGNFTLYDGIGRKHLARLNSDGSLDAAFDAGNINNVIHTLKLMPTGDLLAGGSFTEIDLQPAGRLACFAPDGTISPSVSFGDGADEQVRTIVLAADQKIYIGGKFESMQSFTRAYIAALLPDGTFDEAFMPVTGPSGRVSKTVVLPGNKLVMVGEFRTYNGFIANGLAKVNDDGTIDPSFHCDSLSFFEDIIPVPGNKFLATIWMGTYYTVVRLSGNGQVDPSFHAQLAPGEMIRKVALEPDGHILAAGYFQNPSGISSNYIVRLDPSGSRIPGFEAHPMLDFGTILTMVPESDGKFVVGGEFQTAGGYYSMIRYHHNGIEDTTFHMVQAAQITSISRHNGKYIVSGSFSTVNGFQTVHVARLHNNGDVDHSFSANVPEMIRMIVQPNGKIILGLNDNSMGNLVTRLNADGSDDTGFVINYALGPVLDLQIRPDGRIIVAGGFSGGYAWNHASNLARLENDDLGVSPLKVGVSQANSIISCDVPGTCTVFGYLGEAPYSYAWTGALPPDSSVSVTAAGTYTCTVTDVLGYSEEVTLIFTGAKGGTAPDLGLSLSSAGFRTGFPATAWLDVFNDICIPVSGQLKLIYDTVLLDFVSSDPAIASQSGDTLIWDFTDLQYDPGHTNHQLVFNTSASAAIGDSIHFTALATPLQGDADPQNNTRSYSFPVVNGYDPNFKAVYPAGKCDPHFIVPDQKLSYTIHFQNTGNAEAINIMLLDSLDADLDIQSVRITGKSHDVWIEVLPGNILQFHFDGINLPDSASNEPESHGYVVFEVSPVQGLSYGTQINNTSEIYFDFNPPIRTNTVKNVIFEGDLDTYSCITTWGFDEQALQNIVVYPNPASDKITVLLEGGEATLTVLDTQGNPVLTGLRISSGDELSLKELASGLYFLRFSTSSGQSVHRLVKY